jgi:Transposase domain (DUF772)
VFWRGEGSAPMMGTKLRSFAPQINMSLQELVPHDHFYRHLDQKLDLSFVRERVQQTYTGGGRPSIDPTVFFKLQLVMFFEGIRSERQLIRQAADRLSVGWYLGYDLGEPLPDHASCVRGTGSSPKTFAGAFPGGGRAANNRAGFLSQRSRSATHCPATFSC